MWSLHSWLTTRFPEAGWPDRLFPPTGIFQRSALSFALLSTFTTLDLVQRLATGRTASMAIELRKPAD